MAKILVAINNNRPTLPVYFIKSMTELTSYTSLLHDVETRFYDLYDISAMRNRASKNAIDEGFDYVFYLDSDMEYPRDSIIKLLARDKEIICGQYSSRKVPLVPVQFKKIQEDLADKENYEWGTSGGIVQIEGCGFGGVLVKVSALKKLTYPYFKVVYLREDYFLGEDIGFCIQCKEKGIPIFVDTEVKYGHEAVCLIYPWSELRI